MVVVLFVVFVVIDDSKMQDADTAIKIELPQPLEIPLEP